MDELIQKYLDGDLSEEEAAAFGRALSEDPDLEAELSAFEQALAVVSRYRRTDPSDRFTDRVMERIAAGVSPAGRGQSYGGSRRRAWWPRLAWSAGFAAVFVLGFVTARQSATGPPAPAQTADGSQAIAAGVAADPPFRVVRLVYVPRDEGVETVSVAGTFNGWNPDGTVMRREGGAWVVRLALPPQTYEYMFVENGEQWVTDPLAAQTRDDGFGRENAVLDLTL